LKKSIIPKAVPVAVTTKNKMFASPKNESHAITTSNYAKQQLQTWESLLSFRISLQRSLDLANKLPAFDFDGILENEEENDLPSLRESLKGIQNTLYECLEGQTQNPSSKKVKKSLASSPQNELSWESIIEKQELLEKSWETTLNKWHSRMHFGSEKVKSRLSVFNVNVWEQINDLSSSFQHEKRMVEKSCCSLEDSDRLDIVEMKKELSSSELPRKVSEYRKNGIEIFTEAEEENGRENDGETSEDEEEGTPERKKKDDNKRRKKRKMYDLEVYDDRTFYSLLLKVSCFFLVSVFYSCPCFSS
jgi:hypothetical protein